MTQQLLPTAESVIEKYLEDREKIKELKIKAKLEVEKIEAFQRKREDFLLKMDDISIFEFMTDLFVNGRDGKAAKEKEKQDIGLRQDLIESWLLKMLKKVGKGIRTDAGTVYTTVKESVSVESWDAFLDAEILAPLAKAVFNYFSEETNFAAKDVDLFVPEIERIVRESAHFEYLNHAVNKTAVLECLGEKDEKTGARPNPPPAGVKYTAIAAVGVRKGK